MTDAVTSQVVYRHNNRYVLHLTSVSDGTGESAVIKADRSGLTILGQSPAVAVGHMAIARVHGFVNGLTYVQLLWEHTTDDVAVTLGPGNFDLDFRDYNGVHDPQSSGGTGDLVLTTVGSDNGDVYDITIDLRFYK